MAISHDDSTTQIDVRLASEVGAVTSHGLLSELLLAAARRHLASGDLPDWLITHPGFTPAHLNALIDSGVVTLADLGHHQHSIPLLEMIAREYQYPEAILTLGKHYYTDPGQPLSKWTDFLGQHQQEAWLLKSLAYVEPSSGEKYQAYIDVLKHVPAIFDEVIDLHRSRERQKRAATARTEEEIRSLFQSGDVAVLRFLAANTHTPSDLLRQMTSFTEGRFAKQIRNLARETLRRQREQ